MMPVTGNTRRIFPTTTTSRIFCETVFCNPNGWFLFRSLGRLPAGRLARACSSEPSRLLVAPAGLFLHGKCTRRPADEVIGRATSAAQVSALSITTDAEAEPWPIKANARLTIVVPIVVIVLPPGTIIGVPDNHATVAAGMPALAGVITNDSRLLKQRRTLSDLDQVSRISARCYEGAGAGEKCQCQDSHVYLSLSRNF